MTFFEVIYSPQKADAVAAFVWSCLLVTQSFTAIIFYHLARKCTDTCNHTDTNEDFFFFFYSFIQLVHCSIVDVFKMCVDMF